MKDWIRSHPGRAALVAAALALALLLLLRRGDAGESGTAFAARRGPLDITVLNGGNLESLESEVIRCEVRGEPVKILRLVDEGYTVTAEDIRTNKVLVELDSAKLQQSLVERDVSFQSASSGLTQAREDFEIQRNQNHVDLRSFLQDARFAFMDVEKYLGEKITAEITALLGLALPTNAVAQAAPADAPVAQGAGSPGPATEAADTERPVIDFTRYAKAELLGDGTAKQEIRKREDDLLVSRTELGQALTKLAGTRRLFDKGFVNKTELENDQIGADKARLKVESSQTALDLFVRYEFPKAAQETVSKYDKALRALERTRKEAVSKLAQKRAALKGAEGRYQIEQRNRDDLLSTIEKCVIPARKPGMIVYGGDEEIYWGGRDPIRVGSQVFERQAILTIPDTSRMGVKLGIHESHIQKIAKGQKARIKADAFPDDVLEGEVTKVGVLPDSRNRWMNPDLKLYPCTIAIQGARPWLKPGMSAKVEILVKRIAECTHVPMQAVSVRDGRQVVYLRGGREREVTVGDYNDEFIEIASGLQPGEVVMLRAPEGENPAGKTADTAKAGPAPAPAK